ncbi:MAG: hypothetical protein IKK60_00785 [Clostridia bacterium]|nr:hypothetical protein [Clostridia bacterium]
MFNTLGNFSAVYFTLAAVLFILILFEKHFIRLEDKIKSNRAKRKNTSVPGKAVKPAYKNNVNNVRKNRNMATVRKIPNNAA